MLLMVLVGQMLMLIATTTATESPCRLNIVLALHQSKVFTPLHQSEHLSPRPSIR